MGINREYVATLLDLHRNGTLSGFSRVVDLGAQDISARAEHVGNMLDASGFEGTPVETSDELYRRLGFTVRTSVDTSGERGAMPFDLNQDFRMRYSYRETFDLVTNLGTIEHCFD